MARIPYLSGDDLPKEVRGALGSLLAGLKHDQPPNNLRALATSPAMTVRLFELVNYFLNDSPLDAKLRELAILKVTKANGCPYAFAQHVIWAGRIGFSREKIQQLHNYRNSPLFNDLERMVIELAAQMTVQGKVEEPLFWKLRRSLPVDQLVDLITAVGLWNSISRAMNAFEIDPELALMEVLEWSW